MFIISLAISAYIRENLAYRLFKKCIFCGAFWAVLGTSKSDSLTMPDTDQTVSDACLIHL